MTAHVEEEVDISGVLERVKTGVDAFDELVMGGLPRARTTVVSGTPGSGKTVLRRNFWRTESQHTARTASS